MRIYPYFKPWLDFFAALVLLAVLSPVLLVTAILVKLDSKGPILFLQERPGRFGKIFTVCKFRTMRVETELDGRPVPDTERVTRLGRTLRNFSLDELPQLFNVLLFEMSFIGPRPLLVRYLPFYTPAEMRRHEVRPGISGWAQVNGRNAISWERKFELDLEYVEKVSFLFDCWIAMLTLQKIVKKSNILLPGETDCSLALDIERSGNWRENQ